MPRFWPCVTTRTRSGWRACHTANIAASPSRDASSTNTTSTPSSACSRMDAAHASIYLATPKAGTRILSQGVDIREARALSWVKAVSRRTVSTHVKHVQTSTPP